MTKLGRAGSLLSALALAGCTTVVMGGGETGGGIQDPETSDIALPGGAGGEGAGGAPTSAQTGGAPTGSAQASSGSGAGGGASDGSAARVVTVGTTGIEYIHLHGLASLEGNLPFLMNALSWLAEGRGVEGDYQFLYSRTCDPRTAADVCLLTEDADALDPFYDALGELGDVTYASTAEVTLDDYAVVIVNYCGPHDAVANGPVLDYLRRGGSVLVAGQHFCIGTPSKASALLAPFGIAFTELDPGGAPTLTIAPEDQTGFLEGVERFHTRRWTPQIIEATSPFDPIIESSDGVLAAYAEIDTDSIPGP